MGLCPMQTTRCELGKGLSAQDGDSEGTNPPAPCRPPRGVWGNAPRVCSFLSAFPEGAYLAIGETIWNKLWSKSTTYSPLGPLTYNWRMGKAIIRMQKLKSPVAVRRSMKHAFREQDTPNADPSRTPENTHIGAADVGEALERFNARLPDKVRSNAVLAVEYLITASPDEMRGKAREEQDAYFGDALKWLEAKHGKENVVYAGIHRDETTPHMYAYVVPIDERGKLNCRAFYGEKEALSKMQTDFADKVGKQHGLERGLEGSRARHTDIRQYYARVQAATPRTPDIDVPDGKLLEGKEAYGQRVAKAVLEQIAPELVALRAKAQQTDLAQQQVKVAEQAKAQAELSFQQRENLLKVEREKVKDSAEKTKDLIQTIARGGEPLAKLQAAFRDRIEQSKQKDKGISR